MAELTIDPASIRKALDDFVSSYKPSERVRNFLRAASSM